MSDLRYLTERVGMAKVSASLESNSKLTVSKTVSGSAATAADRTKEFEFTVTLSDTGITGEYGDMAFVNGVAMFTLKHGESKTAEGLPAGITCTVTETGAVRLSSWN